MGMRLWVVKIEIVLSCTMLSALWCVPTDDGVAVMQAAEGSACSV